MQSKSLPISRLLQGKAINLMINRKKIHGLYDYSNNVATKEKSVLNRNSSVLNIDKKETRG